MVTINCNTVQQVTEYVQYYEQHKIQTPYTEFYVHNDCTHQQFSEHVQLALLLAPLHPLLQ
jgi:hypothetical protein